MFNVESVCKAGYELNADSKLINLKAKDKLSTRYRSEL